MNLVRKVVAVGHSKAVIIPKGWLESEENRTGRKVEQVRLRINGSITIEPYFPKEGK